MAYSATCQYCSVSQNVYQKKKHAGGAIFLEKEYKNEDYI